MVMVALLVAACDPAGTGGGALPKQGDYTSNPPMFGTVPCESGAADCAVAPPGGDPGIKPAALAIHFPDYPGKTEFLALPGSAFTMQVATTAAESATLSCTPDKAASLTPTAYKGLYLFFLSPMPDQDVPCTITASSAKGEVKTAIVVKPAPKNTVIPLEVRNFPEFIGVISPVEAGDTVVVPNFYIDGYDATTTKVTASCTVDAQATLIPNPNFPSWYSLKFTAIAAATGTCTVKATRASDNQTDTATATVLYEKGPTITPVNFLATAKLPLVSAIDYVAMVNSGKTAVPPVIQISYDAAVTVTCTDIHGAGLLNKLAINVQNNNYELIITYKAIGQEGSTDTCTVTATDKDKHVSELQFAVVHLAKPHTQVIAGIPALLTITGKTLTLPNITVAPMDADTKMAIQCDYDSKALITQIGDLFSATISQVKSPFPIKDHCLFVATHKGIQTDFILRDVTIVGAQFTPQNYGQASKELYMAKPAGDNFLMAHNADPKKDMKAEFPIVKIEDGEGLASVSIDTCFGPNKDFFDAVSSSAALVGDLYYLNIRYTQFTPDSKKNDYCAIKAVDITGQPSYDYVYLK